MKEPDFKWLETRIQYAKGVGPFLAKLFKKLNIETFEDLIYHIPFRYLDRRKLQDIENVKVGEKQLVLGTVEKKGVVVLGRRGKRVFEVLLRGNRGSLMAKWFHYNQKYLEKRFNRGDKILLFGEVSEFRGQLQMVHPEAQPLSDVISDQEISEYLGLVPVYSSTEGLSQNQIRKIISGLIGNQLEHMGETLPDIIKEKFKFPDLAESLHRIHFPKKEDDYEKFQNHSTDFHKRIIFDEFFYLQLGLTLRRQKNLQVEGIQHRPLFSLRERFLGDLPFELTKSQIKAIETVTQKMCSLNPMNCLLQGDVGSGKTVVAMVGALLSVDNGFQAAIMVPTEILAEQHYLNFERSLEPLGVRVEILTSSTKASDRSSILNRLKKESRWCWLVPMPCWREMWNSASLAW